MSGKRTQKKQQKRKRADRARGVAKDTPSPEQVVGAIVASIAPALFEAPSASGSDGESSPPASLDSSPPATPDTSPPPRHEEHRAHPRVSLSVAIGLESESHFFSGLSGDISEGGVFVQTYQNLPVGSDVEVHFALPDGELTARGQVRWHRDHSDSSPPGVGIAFEELDDEERGLIQSFCERRAPLYYDVEHA
jgi:uncharacterized protein (TIGR02266 family)